ncbi:MAG: hypothetical protein ABSC63_19440 [Candidatus Binataceae bacterium]|jgi:hypothetical protein
MADAAVRRCAIYTRKSSEEGLEQDYNSLHAQREACEAFVRMMGAGKVLDDLSLLRKTALSAIVILPLAGEYQ